MIKVGDTLPSATLMEFIEVEGEGCSVGPNPVEVSKATAGKTIALFAVPGAFTPPAQPATYRVMWSTLMLLKPLVWTKFGVSV